MCEEIIIYRCPICGSNDVITTRMVCEDYEFVYKPVECSCRACGHSNSADNFEVIKKVPEQLKFDYYTENGSTFVYYPDDLLKDIVGDDMFRKIEICLEQPKKKINRPHYKELYEKEKIERAKLQAQFICLKMINENLSKKDQTEKINILLECIDAINKYTSDWYIKNEIKRAREKISKIK